MRKNGQIRRYYGEIRKNLPCRGRRKREFMTKIKSMVDQYLQENPQADVSDVTARFGTPQQIASAYLNEQDDQVLVRDMRVGNRVVKVALAAALVVIMIFAGTMVVALIDRHDDMSGNITRYVVDLGVVETTETGVGGGE